MNTGSKELRNVEGMEGGSEGGMEVWNEPIHTVYMHLQ